MGRLYRRPDCPIPRGVSQQQAVMSGLLVPSVTNVLDVQNQPHLTGWSAKLAAETAFDVAAQFPHRVSANKRGAVNYAKSAAERHRDAAADRGTRVHNALENLSRGIPVEVDDEIAPYVASWEQFMADWEPEWIGIELTMFGSVMSRDGRELGYAGTADGIARLRSGRRVILDYKTGRSVHAPAAAQMAALAHADLASADGETIIPAPEVDAGMVVHITAKGYAVYPVADLDGGPWAAFQSLREAWEWHMHEHLHGSGYALLPKIKSEDFLPVRGQVQ